MSFLTSDSSGLWCQADRARDAAEEARRRHPLHNLAKKWTLDAQGRRCDRGQLPSERWCGGDCRHAAGEDLAGRAAAGDVAQALELLHRAVRTLLAKR